MKLSNNKILITGGASGIGRGIAERFLKENNQVIVCGRREDVLREVAEQLPGIITKRADVEDPAEREALFAWVAKEHPDLNTLVNNAGIQNWMTVSDKDFFIKAQKEIAINIEAPLHLASLFLDLPSLNTIINVSSGLAYIPFAKVPVYSATKAFLHSFTLSLRYLLQGRNIEVIEVIPPVLNTDLGGKGLHDHAPPVADFIEAIFTQLQQGKKELTFGFAEAMTKAGPEELQKAFDRLNP
jgi:uncharacterized oxidoreductase